MVLRKTKRLVEAKRDVIILLDSITRLARAHNTVTPHSGKILSGGVDAYPCTNQNASSAQPGISKKVRSQSSQLPLIDTGSPYGWRGDFEV